MPEERIKGTVDVDSKPGFVKVTKKRWFRDDKVTLIPAHRVRSIDESEYVGKDVVHLYDEPYDPRSRR